jgi:hypothetical protein
VTTSVFVDGHVRLDSPATMFAVLAELVEKDPTRYKGTVAGYPDGAGGAQWRLELNVTETTTADVDAAAIGDHIVLPYGRLMKLTDAEYQAAQ